MSPSSTKPVRAIPTLEEVRAERARRSITFRQWVEKVRPKYRWYRHCEALGEVLQRVADGEIKRLMVFEPPRHGKSEQVSRLFSAYYLWKYPHRWVGVSSYAADLAYTLSRAARENFGLAGGALREDAFAVKHWQTRAGGGLWAAGVGGPITGKGWHLGIIDDPLKNAEEAASAIRRETQKDWYQSTFYTREEPVSDADPNGALIVVQTRWHEDDLSGWLLAQESEEDEAERWHVVCYEAIKSETLEAFPPTCTLEPDWRQPGEALCPERRPADKLRKIEARIGPYYWGALFQQTPKPRDGSFFKVDQIRIEATAPPLLRMVRAWDLAATAGAGDYTVGVLMGLDAQGRFWILDIVRGQWSTDDRNARILATGRLDGATVRIRGPQDPGAAGVEAGRAFVRLLTGLPARTERVTGTKESRADPFSAQVNVGNVILVRDTPERRWNRAFLDELRGFPLAKHDDQVDAASDAFNDLAAPAAGVPLAGGQRPMTAALNQAGNPYRR